jgi:hypothetical protein
MSIAYNKNKKSKRAISGTPKKSGYWSLVKTRFKDAKGKYIMKKKTGKNKETFVPKWYGI